MYQFESSLRELDLNRGQINILKLLMSSKRPLKVKEVSAAVKLPLGRSYVFLNGLWKMGLIDRNTEAVTRFSISDPELKFRNFIRSRYAHIEGLEKGLLESIPKLQSRETIVPIHSDEDTYHSVYQAVQEADPVKAIAASPLLLIPGERRNFWRQELFGFYRKRIAAGTEFWYMISGKAFRKALKKRDMRSVEANAKWLFRHGNFHLVVVGTENIITAAITDKEAVIAFREPYAHNVIGGVVMKSADMVGFLDTVYTELVKQGTEVRSFAQLMKVTGA